MKAFTNLSKKLQIAFVTGVFAFLFGVAGIFAASTPTQAFGCDKVNIVYCGLSGSSTSGYISSVKKLYSTGSDGHFSDIKSVMTWGRYNSTMVKGMNTTNTKVGTLYRDGRVVVGGKTVATGTWISARFNGGSGFVQIKSGVWARKTTTSMMHSSDKVLITFDASGKAVAGTVIRCGNMLRFTPVKPPAPAKKLVCDSLTVTPRAGTRTVDAVVAATATNTTITGYKIVWGDGATSTTKTASHTYAADGTYTIKAYVSSADFSNVTSTTCEKTVTVNVPVAEKALQCVELKVAPTSIKNQYTLTATGQTTNVTISGYKFVFGDGQTAQVNTSATSATTSHTYQAGKTYDIVASVSGGTFTDVTSANCQYKLEVPPEEVPKNPAVTITKTVNGVKTIQVAVGETFTYEVTVKNTGDVALTNVLVTDKPDAGIVLVSSEGNLGTISNNQWSYTLPSLAVGESKTFKFTAKVTEATSEALVNTACVNAKEVNPNEPTKKDACDEATVTVKVQNPNVTIVKTINGGKDTPSLKVGEAFTYEIIVKNTGEVALTNVLVHDLAPDGVAFTGLANGTPGVIDDNGKWSYTIPSLAVGESVKFVINAKVTEYKSAPIVNVACVNAPSVNPNEPTKDDACDQANLVTPKEPEVLGETKETPAPTPTVLPNTGAAGVVSLTLGVSLLSSVFYSVAQSRKLARE